MHFGLNESDARGLRRLGVAWAALMGLVAALAFASPAQAAAPYMLEIVEDPAGTGFGAVACQYTEGGEVEVEEPCKEEFATKKLLKLIPVPEEGSKFVGFTTAEGSASACKGLTKPCTFTLQSDTYVEARFDEILPPSLVIKYLGTGEGEVACAVEGGPAEACEEEYEWRTEITLVPEPEEGSKFVGFTTAEGSASACKGLTKPCTFTLEANSSIEASFEKIPPPSLFVKYSGTGEGEVACAVAGGPAEACEEEYESGTEITLVPKAEKGSEFLGFKNGKGSAEKCVGLNLCSFFLEANSSIEASFGPIMHALTITKAGTGQGTVTCNGASCASSYAEGTEVTLKATPASGSTFAGWSGDECSGTGTCLVTIETAPAAVTATFDATSKPTPTPVPTPEPEGTAKAGAIAKVKGGRAQVKLSCAGGPCNGTLKLTAKLLQGGKRKSLTIGKGSFALTDGSSKTLKVRLSASAVRELAKAHSLKARAGGSNVVAGSVKLKLAAGG